MQTIAFLRAVPGAEGEDPIIGLLANDGFVLGKNLAAFAADRAEAYPSEDGARRAVEGWVADGVDLIIAQSSLGASVAAASAPAATVVFLVNDPSAAGLVVNERRPEGRLTGATFRVPADRTLVSARDALPGLARIGVLYSATDVAALPHRDAVAAAAKAVGVTPVLEPFDGDGGARDAIDELARAGVDAVFITNSPTAVRSRDAIEARTVKHRLPVIANTDLFPFALVVLQPDVTLLTKQLARQVARLLSGASPPSVPVEDPRRFELILNAKTAAAMDIELAPDLVRQATKVIQ